MSCKDELLKFVDQEMADRRDSDQCEMKDSLIRLNRECQELKTENANLKDHVSCCTFLLLVKIQLADSYFTKTD